MKQSKNVHLKTYFMLALMMVFAPLGNVLLGKGMKGVSAAASWQPSALLGVGRQVIGSPFIWLGVASLLTFFVAYMVVLSWADYSYVQPASSFSYAVVALLGYLLLGEAVPPLRAAGIAIICLGVFVVGRTPPRTTEPL
jgi:drug/metabolite transporter (DMT)-like permease